MAEGMWGGVHARETTTEAGGTHPTGMHYCFASFFFFLIACVPNL